MLSGSLLYSMVMDLLPSILIRFQQTIDPEQCCCWKRKGAEALIEENFLPTTCQPGNLRKIIITIVIIIVIITISTIIIIVIDKIVVLIFIVYCFSFHGRVSCEIQKQGCQNVGRTRNLSWASNLRLACFEILSSQPTFLAKQGLKISTSLDC